MSRKLALRALTLAALLLALPAAVRADVVLGQVDTFQTGPAGWVRGFGAGPPPTTPLPVSNGGGPAGAGDNFLLLTATGGDGPLSRISAINNSQWAGNYIAAGVNAITMDVNNFGPSALSLRLAVAGPFGPMGPQNIAFTTNAVVVPAGSGWTSVTFLIGPGDLTASVGTATGALTNAGAFRLFHNPDPFFAPMLIPPVNATLGVDNITAAAIPEPATMLLLGTGLAGVVGAARRRRRR